MIRYRRRYWALAAALSTVAGFVDAIAFVHLGGYFVSFMSGNSTRLGVGLAQALPEAALAGGLIGCFVLGVMLGAFANRNADRAGSLRVMILTTATLAVAALVAQMHFEALAIAALALAMGATNSVFQRDGEVSIGVTYMTGTLVRFGQRLAGALMGKDAFAWAPYLLLWAGLVLGAACGAFAYGAISLGSIWIAAVISGALALTNALMPHAD